MAAKKAHPRDVTQTKKETEIIEPKKKKNKQTNKQKNNSDKSKKIVGVLHRGNPPRKEICHVG